MNYPLFIGLVGLLAVANFFIGKFASKGLKNTEDYFLMGRELKTFPLMFTFLATQLGGGTLVGAAQTAYQQGWVVIFYPLGVFLGLFALGLGYGKKLKKLNLSTIPEIFVEKYNAPILRLLASALSVVTLFCITIGQAIAIKTLFASLGFTNPLFFLFFWGVLVTYTVMGGFKAVVQTDILQAAFILVALGMAVLSVDYGSLSFSTSEVIGSGELGQVPFVQWLILPFLFMFIEQDMGQRCFAAKDEKIIAPAAIGSALILIVGSLIAIFFGIAAKTLGIEIPPESNVLVETIKALTNPVTTTFFFAAIFMAVISTADSLLCSISSNIVCDFMPQAKGMGSSRGITFLIGFLAYLAAYVFTDVVSVLMFSYELSVSVLFVPITTALCLKTPSRNGAIASIVAGTSCYLLFQFTPPPFPKELLTLFLSGVSYFIFSSKIGDIYWKNTPIEEKS